MRGMRRGCASPHEQEAAGRMGYSIHDLRAVRQADKVSDSAFLGWGQIAEFYTLNVRKPNRNG